MSPPWLIIVTIEVIQLHLDRVEAGHRDLRGRPTITDDGGHPRQPENVQEHPELLQQPQAHLEILQNGSILLKGAHGDMDQRIRTDHHAELRSAEIQRNTLPSDPDPSLDHQFQPQTIRDEVEEVAFEPATTRHITVR